MEVTVVSMYRGYDAEMFGTVVPGTLNDDQKDKWRKAHKCDDHHCDDEEICDEHNSMFFQVFDLNAAFHGSQDPTSLLNLDGDL